MILFSIEKFHVFQEDAVNRIASSDTPEKGSLLYWRASILFSLLFADLRIGFLAAIAGYVAKPVEMQALAGVVQSVRDDMAGAAQG